MTEITHALSRRGLLSGALALVAVSAMPSSAFANLPTIYGDGVHDDAPGLQALIDGEPFRHAGKFLCGRVGDTVTLAKADYILDVPLIFRAKQCVVIVGESAEDRPRLHLRNATHFFESDFNAAVHIDRMNLVVSHQGTIPFHKTGASGHRFFFTKMEG